VHRLLVGLPELLPEQGALPLINDLVLVGGLNDQVDGVVGDKKC